MLARLPDDLLADPGSFLPLKARGLLRGFIMILPRYAGLGSDAAAMPGRLVWEGELVCRRTDWRSGLPFDAEDTNAGTAS